MTFHTSIKTFRLQIFEKDHLQLFLWLLTRFFDCTTKNAKTTHTNKSQYNNPNPYVVSFMLIAADACRAAASAQIIHTFQADDAIMHIGADLFHLGSWYTLRMIFKCCIGQSKWVTLLLNMRYNLDVIALHAKHRSRRESSLFLFQKCKILQKKITLGTIIRQGFVVYEVHYFIYVIRWVII